ncbi:MAG: hypothetical protein AAF747_04330, partial [Planctomycetota bacterium]
MNTNRSRGRIGKSMGKKRLQPAQLLEACEPRKLLSAVGSDAIDFIGVGFDGTTAVLTLTQLDENGAATRVRFDASDEGLTPSTSDDLFTSLGSLPGLGLSIAGTDATNAVATDFTAAGASPIGFFASDDDRFEFFAAPSTDTELTLSDLAGAWRLTTVQFLNDDLVGFDGTADVSGSLVLTQLTGDAPLGQVLARSVSAPDPAATDVLDRVFTLQDGSVLIPTADPDYYLFIDGSSALGLDQGATGIGVLHRTQGTSDVDASTLPGQYRALISADGPLADSTFGSTGTQDWLIELVAGGRYRVLDLSGAEAGTDTLITTGSWSLEGTTVLLDDDAGFDVQLYIGSSVSEEGGETSNVLVPFNLSEGSSFNRLAGVASQIPDGLGSPGDEPTDPPPPPPDPIDARIAIGGVDSNGDPLAYDLRNTADAGEDPTEAWFVTDVRDVAMGDPDEGAAQTGDTIDSDTYLDPESGQLVTVTTANDGVFVYRRGEDTTVSVRNLTDELTGAEAIATGLTIFTDVDDVIYISGLNSVRWCRSPSRRPS